MSDREKIEQEIMNQELSRDEMETVAGGACPGTERMGLEDVEKRDTGCSIGYGAFVYCNSGSALKYGRPFYRPDGSINCAATVEDGSWCHENDACYRSDAVYLGMQDCYKAWK